MRAAAFFRRELTGPIARSTIHTTGVLLLRMLVQAATLLVLARVLGAAQFAALAGLLALAVFLGALGTFGTHLVLVRDLARDPGRRDALLPAALGTTMVCGAVLLLVYLLICFAALHRLPVRPATVWCIGFAELLVQPLLTISASERLAVGKIVRSQLLRIVPLPLQLATAVSLWFSVSADPLVLYAVGHLAAATGALVLSVSLQNGRWPPLRRWRLLDRSGWKENSGFALLALTASGPTELDKTLSARLLPLATAGVYSAASRVTGALVMPVASLMISVLPRLFRESGEGLPPSRLLRWIFCSSLAYGVAATACLWLLAPFLGALFGSGYVGLGSTIRWLSLSVPGLCLRMAAVNILMTIGNQWLRVTIEAAGIATMVACALTFAPGGAVNGMIGAVISAEGAMALLAWGWIASRYARGGVLAGHHEPKSG